jgi:hypothetical protein
LFGKIISCQNRSKSSREDKYCIWKMKMPITSSQFLINLSLQNPGTGKDFVNKKLPGTYLTRVLGLEKDSYRHKNSATCPHPWKITGTDYIILFNKRRGCQLK